MESESELVDVERDRPTACPVDQSSGQRATEPPGRLVCAMRSDELKRTAQRLKQRRREALRQREPAGRSPAQSAAKAVRSYRRGGRTTGGGGRAVLIKKGATRHGSPLLEAR